MDHKMGKVENFSSRLSLKKDQLLIVGNSSILSCELIYKLMITQARAKC